MNTRARLTMICVLTAVGACETSTPIGVVEVAGTSGQTPTDGSGTSGSAGTYVPSAGEALVEAPFKNPSGISGDWVGYLENYDLYFTGSDTLKFHFGTDAQGNGTITVVQGTDTPPAPPTEAFDEWPVPAIDSFGGPGPGLIYPDAPLSGFVYTARAVTWQGKRLKFRRVSAEPWEPWCALQTSYPLPGNQGTYTCNAGNSVTYPTRNTCLFTDGPPGARCTRNHLHMCSLVSGVCGCNATGCGATTRRSDSFDITFFADGAVGSMSTHHLVLMPATP
jgi:hypothetical protein